LFKRRDPQEAAQSDHVHFFVPSGQNYVDATNLVNKQTYDVQQQITVREINTSGDVDLLNQLLPLRRLSVAMPLPADPVSSHANFFATRSDQRERANFHIKIFQDQESGEKLKSLCDEWTNALPIGKEVCLVSVLSRAHELVWLDHNVFKPKKHFLIVTTGNSWTYEDEKMNKVIEIINIDTKGLNDEMRAQENFPYPALEDEITKPLNSRVGELGTMTWVVNGTSGTGFLSDCLRDWIKSKAPDGSFFVRYEGQTDIERNLPILGSHRLVIKKKTQNGCLEYADGQLGNAGPGNLNALILPNEPVDH